MEETKIRKKDNVKINFIFQITYQTIILVLPLITAPYLTRVLGKTILGDYGFTFSVAYYFVVLANLGIGKHGQRIISARRNDEIALRKSFWSLLFVHTIVSLISLFSYLIFSSFQTELREFYFIQSFYVLSALFDITWFFYGMENFKSVVIKNFILKILETLLIFLFVKNKNDQFVYAFIMVGSLCLGYIVLLPQAIRWAKPIRFSFADIKEHIKPLLLLSIAVIASSLYTIFDKTLLGLMTNNENVAYYEYSYKIVNIPKSIIIVIGTVLFPKACSSFAAQNEKEMEKYFKYGILFTYFMGFASLFGLLAVSNLFSALYYDPEFLICGDIIKCMAPIIIIISIGDIVRMQFLIPMGKDVTFIVISIINSVINILLSILLISFWNIYGAIIASIISETIGTILLLVVCRKYVNFKILISQSIPFILAGAAMYGLIEVIKIYYNESIGDLVIQIICGAFCYCFIIFVWLFFISRDRSNYRSIVKKVLRIK